MVIEMYLLKLLATEAVGSYYEDFAQVTDEEVVDILARARKSTRAAG